MKDMNGKQLEAGQKAKRCDNPHHLGTIFENKGTLYFNQHSNDFVLELNSRTCNTVEIIPWEDTEKTIINLSSAEIQSKHSRVKFAEGLILQLPETHDGRNSWLLNYGIGKEAKELRSSRKHKYKDKGYTPRKLIWNNETDCLDPVD